jgi:hypothetical protein
VPELEQVCTTPPGWRVERWAPMVASATNDCCRCAKLPGEGARGTAEPAADIAPAEPDGAVGEPRSRRLMGCGAGGARRSAPGADQCRFCRQGMCSVTLAVDRGRGGSGRAVGLTGDVTA